MGKYQDREAMQVKNWLEKGASFMFVPSANLVEMAVKDVHPLIKKLPKTFKYVIIQNKPIRIEGQMALDYYEGKSDEKNAFILDNGDIKIITERIEI